MSIHSRLRSMTDRKTVMLVISDGNPSCDPLTTQQAVAETRKAVEQMQKDRIHCLQIGIGTDPAQQGLMFDHFVTYGRAEALAAQLRKAMAEIIKKKQRC